jgi:hypothetical protein
VLCHCVFFTIKFVIQSIPTTLNNNDGSEVDSSRHYDFANGKMSPYIVF